MDNIVSYQSITDNAIENDEDFILPLNIFPNDLGVNLCSVKGFEITRQPDGQIINIRIDFIPN